MKTGPDRPKTNFYGKYIYSHRYKTSSPNDKLSSRTHDRDILYTVRSLRKQCISARTASWVLAIQSLIEKGIWNVEITADKIYCLNLCNISDFHMMVGYTAVCFRQEVRCCHKVNAFLWIAVYWSNICNLLSNLRVYLS